MDNLPIDITCPLDSVCRKIVDNRIKQCAWLVNVQGKPPQSEEMVDEWRCSMAWTPILLVENAQTNRGQTQAIESFRNAITRQNNELLAIAIDKRVKLEG